MIEGLKGGEDRNNDHDEEGARLGNCLMKIEVLFRYRNVKDNYADRLEEQ